MRTLLVLMFLVAVIPQAHANLRDGLVGWWKFDEASGNAIDSSDSGNNGVLQNSPTRISACKRGQCLDFNGTNQYVSVGSLSSPSSITVSFWNFVKSTDVQQSGPFCFVGQSTSNRVSSHVPWSDRVLYWDFGNATSGQGRVTFDYTNYLNKWTLVTLIFNASTNLHAIYLDGVLVASHTNAAAATTLTGLQIGVFSEGSSVYHKGKIDDFRLYNRALSASEVADLYKSGVVIKNAVIRGNSRINQ